MKCCVSTWVTLPWTWDLTEEVKTFSLVVPASSALGVPLNSCSFMHAPINPPQDRDQKKNCSNSRNSAFRSDSLKTYMANKISLDSLRSPE